MKTYRESDFKDHGLPQKYLQDNQSLSHKGVLRGLHSQLQPRAQEKIVRVVSGRIWDVVVDIRKKSPHFGQWVSIDLTAENHFMLFVPAGFAHGFLSLEDNTIVEYKCTSEYDSELRGGIRWNDPSIAIPWPIENPIMSAADLSLPFLRDFVDSL